MKKRFLIVCCLMVVFFAKPSFAASNYGEFEDFKSLKIAYEEAIEKGDTKEMKRIEEIADQQLEDEILYNSNQPENITPYIYNAGTFGDTIGDKYKAMFNRFFYTGYWENRSNGITLTLKNKKSYWSAADKKNGWNATYAMFHGSSNWRNTSIMQKQFYCHARLGYAAYEKEWNLEPWRTKMNSVTCN
ncbi:DUF2599 domain-containing protein [Finegoldia sp. BIOML-A3]|uniref:DUF2599 domain-containing protein n=1 Tax=unclassified Finegoldia TaxID=2619637 RepID=UPI0012B03FBE|nr:MULTISPECIES: DUF2599 domain-containing protein [unclassified Finegoldia]MSA99052.1 DUF2599 domain-containing protein [Finegoldia sp. BIOML-A3]MSB93054.1 DUF2599 domain-containing protein [Finegoldia sp. BIOML-A4]